MLFISSKPSCLLIRCMFLRCSVVVIQAFMPIDKMHIVVLPTLLDKPFVVVGGDKNNGELSNVVIGRNIASSNC